MTFKFVSSIAVAKVDVLDEGSLGVAFAGSAVVVSALGYPKNTVEVTVTNFSKWISVENSQKIKVFLAVL